MARPFKCRRVSFMPGATYFKPAGIPLRMLKENRLSMEELEAIRLRDIEHLEQEQGARKMNISRPTFQRVLASARKKIADALLSGKALRIEGGNYEFAAGSFTCCGQEINLESAHKINGGTMKIAIATENGTSLSQHFGRATQYSVVNAEDGKITGRETRPKVGHGNFQEQVRMSHDCGCGVHGHGVHSAEKHAAMAENIKDCDVLLAGGMGYGAYESLKSYGIEPVVTDVQDIDQAVKLYLEGKLTNLMQRLH